MKRNEMGLRGVVSEEDKTGAVSILSKMAHRLLRRGLGSAFAVVALLASTQAYALTNVNGTITTDTTWDIVGSPYVLTGRFL